MEQRRPVIVAQNTSVYPAHYVGFGNRVVPVPAHNTGWTGDSDARRNLQHHLNATSRYSLQPIMFSSIPNERNIPYEIVSDSSSLAPLPGNIATFGFGQH